MNEDDEFYTCRCGAEMLEWQRINHDFDVCIYERCDDANCCALKAPVTLDDYKAAYEHWKSHRLQSGCSHGH